MLGARGPACDAAAATAGPGCTAPSSFPAFWRQHYLGSAMVDIKTNEIPVARELFKKLDLDGRRVSLDALHTQDQTARELVLEHGADYLFTVKDNQPTLRANIEKLIPAPPADFSPSAPEREPGGHA